MIANERQYGITRKKARSFVRAIEEFDATSSQRVDAHPRLLRAEREAMESQFEELREEMEEYERLKSKDLSVLSVASFDELAEGLIKARIATGLNQQTLAQRLGLKEQQIQRYEAERYAPASYRRLCEVAHALGVRIENDILLPVVPSSFTELVAKVGRAGLSPEFVVERLLSSADAAIAHGEVPDEGNEQMLTAKTAAVLERVFGWRRDDIFGAQELSTPRSAVAAARFKMPRRRIGSATGAFAAYASHLAAVTAQSMTGYPREEIPTEPCAMRRRILARGQGSDDLRTVLHTVWYLGVVVLPLKGKGTFHGACWRYEGRNAIVLKQTSKHEARWVFDLLHELFHAGQRPEEETFELVEADETSSKRWESDEEIAASQFAGDVMLDGKADALATLCTKEAGNAVARLKRVFPQIATRYGVGIGALANYLAFRLSWQGVNWWGAASNLQREDSDPWSIARDVFVERHPYRIENEIDRSLLDRALN